MPPPEPSVPVDQASRPMPPARADHPVLLGTLLGIFAVAIAVTMLRNPQGVVVSADAGYAPMAVPLLLVPAALTVVLTRLLPTGSGGGPATVRRRSGAVGEAGGLIALAMGFVLLVPVLPRAEDYVLLKFMMFLVVPVLVLGVLGRRGRHSVDISRPRMAPWIVLAPVLVLGVLSNLGPFAPAPPSARPPAAMLIVAATATAITAGLGEEVLFRRLLQTRLEALTGPWAGILGASLVFGLMHSFSHGEGPLWADALQAISLQGTTGIALGVIWNRWRRLWACVLAHVLLNGLLVVLYLLGALG